MATGFNVSSLTTYTKPATEFLTAALVYPDGFSKYDIQTNIQSTKRLSFLDADPILQAYSCAMTSTGSTTFTDKTITVVAMGNKTPYCLNELRAKDIVGEYGTGTGVANPTLGGVLLKENTDILAYKQEKMLWAGAIASGDLMDGWITEILADADCIGISGAIPSATTIDNIIAEIIENIPEAVMASRQNIEIHLSQLYYNMYRANRIASNMYHDDPSNLGGKEMAVFGYPEITLVAEAGLVGKTTMVASWNKNFVIGTDQVGEVASAKFVYVEAEATKNDTVYLMASWKIGNTYKFSEEIVFYKVV